MTLGKKDVISRFSGGSGGSDVRVWILQNVYHFMSLNVLAADIAFLYSFSFFWLDIKYIDKGRMPQRGSKLIQDQRVLDQANY